MLKLLLIVLSSIALTTVSWAEITNTGTQSVNFTRSKDAKSLWQLRVNDAKLSQVLLVIQWETGVVIHHSLPDAKNISATCVDGQVAGILRCVLGANTNLAFSQSAVPNNAKQRDVADEIWILSSSLAVESQTSCISQVPVETADTENTVIGKLFQNVNDADPRQRADALFELAKQQDADPQQVEAELQKALSDASGMVRSQALSAWFYRQGNDLALPELQRAMQDEDVSVRLQAVELIENQDLLIRAAQDKDDLVRQLANTKLAVLKP